MGEYLGYMENKVPLTLIVNSCDNYSDLWKMFVDTFEKNFPDFEGDKRIISNHKTFEYQGFTSLGVGDDVSWSSNLIKALDSISTEYILLAIDDLFLKEKVKYKSFYEIFNDFVSLDGNYLKMIVAPRSSVRAKSRYFNVLEKGTLYRSTAVLAIWRKSVLKEMLIEEENAWEFEENSASRSDCYDGFYVVRTNFFTTLHMVVRGKVLRKSVKELQQLVPNWREHTAREVQTKSDAMRQAFKDLRHLLFGILVPSKLRRRVKRFFV